MWSEGFGGMIGAGTTDYKEREEKHGHFEA